MSVFEKGGICESVLWFGIEETIINCVLEINRYLSFLVLNKYKTNWVDHTEGARQFRS